MPDIYLLGSPVADFIFLTVLGFGAMYGIAVVVEKLLGGRDD